MAIEPFHNHFINRWMKTAVFFFFIASLFGTLMRSLFVWEIPLLEYRHLLQAHSHTALLGWGYLLVSGSLLFLFIKQTLHEKVYRRLLTLNILASSGMAFFFSVARVRTNQHCFFYAAFIVGL